MHRRRFPRIASPIASLSAPRLIPAFSISSRYDTLVLLAHRPSVSVAPGERAVNDIANESDDSARKMRKDNVEELVRAIGRVALKRGESFELHLLRRQEEFRTSTQGF